MSRRSRMTLVEIMIVFVIIALMIVVLFPALGIARRKAKASVCTANLKAQARVMRDMAMNNNHMAYPPTTVSLTSMCEQGIDLRATMIASVPTYTSFSEKAFYCPMSGAQDPLKLWTVGRVSVWGYVWLNDRGWGGRKFSTLSPPLQYVERPFTLRSPDSVMLAADVTITDRDTAPFDFAPPRAAVPFGTSHRVKNGQSEVNVLYADGHVDTVKLNMKTATPLAQPGGGWFWLPN